MAAQLSATELAEEYGMSYAFFSSQPELMTLLKSAVAGQWTADRFKAELKNTTWWKDTSSTARQAQVQKATDPATYQANIAAATVQARDAAVQAGAILTSKQLGTLASNIVNYGWDDDQVNNFLGGYVSFSANHVLGGQAGTAANQIRQAAYDNGVNLSDQVVKNYAAYVVKGLTTVDNVLAQIQQQAAGAYPAYAEQIGAGQSVQDIAQPYIQAMAKTMGVPDSSLSAATPQIKQALTAKDSTGKPAPLSVDAFTTQLRQSPEWGKTTDAVNSAMAAGRQVLQDMGLVS